MQTFCTIFANKLVFISFATFSTQFAMIFYYKKRRFKNFTQLPYTYIGTPYIRHFKSIVKVINSKPHIRKFQEVLIFLEWITYIHDINIISMFIWTLCNIIFKGCGIKTWYRSITCSDIADLRKIII